MTHDYVRHGTTSLFAALEVATGKVSERCFRRHTHQEFLAFLKILERKYRRREIHLICDNYGTHKHPAVRTWLAEHPRFHLHLTPTSASWLNLVERWFARITQEAIRRGTFTSVAALERAILLYTDLERRPETLPPDKDRIANPPKPSTCPADFSYGTLASTDKPSSRLYSKSAPTPFHSLE